MEMDRRSSSDESRLIIDEDSVSETITVNSSLDDLIKVLEQNSENEQNNRPINVLPIVVKTDGENLAAPSKIKKPLAQTKKNDQNKMFYFKLNTIKDLKSTSLRISAKSQTFYNMRLFFLPGYLLTAEVSRTLPIAPPMAEIELKQLLSWPEISITVNLQDVTYTRQLRANYERDLVIGDEFDININKEPNVIDTRQIATVISKYTEISRQLFETYISAMVRSAALIDLSKSRLPELQLVLEKIKTDSKPLPSIQHKAQYSRFPNKQKYMRIFDNDPDHNNKRKCPKVALREVINPEVVFTIDRCRFTNDKIDEWETSICNYFKYIFLYQDLVSLNALREMFKKSITMQCMICHQVFEGVLCIIATKAHLSKHFYDKQWSCVKCKQSWSQYDLANKDWIHDCLEINENK